MNRDDILRLTDGSAVSSLDNVTGLLSQIARLATQPDTGTQISQLVDTARQQVSLARQLVSDPLDAFTFFILIAQYPDGSLIYRHEGSAEARRRFSVDIGKATLLFQAGGEA